jgi:hypothetical protein
LLLEAPILQKWRIFRRLLKDKGKKEPAKVAAAASEGHLIGNKTPKAAVVAMTRLKRVQWKVDKYLVEVMSRKGVPGTPNSTMLPQGVWERCSEHV